jgi:hypothetical protein
MLAHLVPGNHPADLLADLLGAQRCLGAALGFPLDLRQ